MGLPCGCYNTTYAKDMAILRTKTHWALLIGGLILLFSIPLWSSAYLLHIINYVGILIIATIGLNILTGYCGQFSIGHAAFIGVGGYTSAILTTNYGFPFLGALICAGLMAGLIGMVFGLPALRVKGFYLIMATLAAQFILVYIFGHWDSMTGGALGFHVVAASIGPLVFLTNRSQFYIIMIVLVLGVYFAQNLSRMQLGRAFVAIRDNDLAAEVMGINLWKYKLIAFFIGCFYAGIAGSLYVHWMRSVIPEHFSLLSSIWYCAYLIIGGMGTGVGPFLGVGLVIGLTELLRMGYGAVAGIFPYASVYFAAGNNMLFGLVLILFLIFEPRGLAHRWGILKTSYRLWPFSY